MQNDYDQLMEAMLGMEIIDTHEHLPSEENRLASSPDFNTMFGHYCGGDLLAAGMSGAELEAFRGSSTPVPDKWRLFEPFYNLIRDGSYSRAAHIAMDKFYGLSELNSLADAELLTERIREANKPGLYKRVLKDACKIRVSMNFGAIEDDREFFAPVMNVVGYSEVSRGVIRELEDSFGVSCATLTAYVDAVRKRLLQLKEQGMKGIKFHFAYMRDLDFAPRTLAEAEPLFIRATEEGYGWRYASLGYEESRPLQDYMVHRLVEIAGELDVPAVFHTGLQGTIDQCADDSRPLRLWNLPHRYRKTDFVVLHSGFPWMEDAALLAKQFPNVYLDLAWAHLMSPTIASRRLETWVDLVPMHKVFGFGGDYCVVEKVYGHLTLARQNIARAFAKKIDEGALTLDRAKAWIQAMLWDNPNRVFRLDAFTEQTGR